MSIQPKKRTYGSRALAGSLALLAGILAFDHAVAQDKPIKAGFFFDMTGGGGASAEAAQFGAQIAAAEINAAGGIGGRKIDVVFADTQTDATVGVGEIKRLLLQDKVEFVMGPLISQVLIASAPVLNEAKVASIGSTGSELITPTVAPYYFSALVNAEAQAKVMAAQAVNVLKVKSAAILSDNAAQAKSFVEALKKELQAQGVELKGAQEYAYRATDMTPQLLALRRGNPDTLFLFSSTGEDVGHALRSLTDLGWDIRVTGNYSVAAFANVAVGIAGKESFAKTTGVNYRAFTYCEGGEKPEAFLQFFQKAKAHNPDLAARLSMPYASLMYEGMWIFKRAIEASGGKTDGPTLAAWIEANASKQNGVLGPLNASPTSHFLVGPSALSIVRPTAVGDGGIQLREGC